MKEKIIKTGVTLASMTAGAMLSRVLVKELPIKNEMLKKGGFALLGLVSATLLNRKTTGKAIAQDMAIATTVTQAGALLKDVLDEKVGESGMLKTALGSPYDNWNEPMYLDSTEFLSSYSTPNYDFISEDIEFEEVEEFNS